MKKTYPYPHEEKTRAELFNLLGVQGGTCHQLPELIRLKDYRKTRSLPLVSMVFNRSLFWGSVQYGNEVVLWEPVVSKMQCQVWRRMEISPDLERWLVGYVNNRLN